MKTRIYITEEILNPGRLPVLVEAATVGQAARHVAGRMFITRVATTREVADLVGAGHRVETAGDTGPYLPASKPHEATQ